jgi:hypothetical protein
MSHVDDGTLHAYLDGELSPPEAQSVEAHVAQCPACRTRLEEERALIARAGELLAQATPPDRELPVFRPGDLKPPVRLWWRVRLPLAWAATVALALGIGTFFGESTRRAQMPSDHETRELANQLARNAPSLDSLAAPARQSSPESRARRSPPKTPPAVGVLADETKRRPAQSMADSTSRFDSVAYREEGRVNAQDLTSAEAERRVAAKAAPAPAPRPEMVSLGDRGSVIKGEPIGVDSARLLLGRDPLVVPNVPIRAIYRARMIGYSGLVIIEQALDSSTVIEVINGRASPLQLAEVVVTGAAAARRDTQSPGAQAPLSRRPDSAPPPQPAAVPPAPSVTEKARRVSSDLFVDVRGPLSTDSLAALRRLLRPLRP